MDFENRVLLYLATSRDAVMARDVLARAQVPSQACEDLACLGDEIGRGAGALLLAEELLRGPALAALTDILARQAPWSDIMVLVLARQGADSPVVARAMEQLPNVTVIERPMRVAALVSATRSALRARGRQYQMRAVFDGLRQDDARKTAFLATLAHELRNPLAPLSNALTLLSQGGAADAPRYVALMRRQVDHLSRLVDDLMEVSRITRGRLDLQMHPLRLDAVIRDAIEQSRPLVEAAGHALAVDLPADTLTLRGDYVRLTQVFSNLLNNAAKYTPRGGRLQLSVRREGDDAVITVADSGVGLPAEMLEPIFDMFVQVGGSARQAQGGLGIGLTLVRSLVELHGGSVQAASRGLHQGATFTVRLPLVRDAASVAAAPADCAQAPPLARRVLVVDDNHDAADSLSDLLRTLGATVYTAYAGAEALRLSTGTALDVAVLDIGMPGMDGCQLARELRSRLNGARGPAPLLIALTGWGQEVDRQRIAAAGFDHHLLKPVDAGTLCALLMPGARVQ